MLYAGVGLSIGMDKDDADYLQSQGLIFCSPLDNLWYVAFHSNPIVVFGALGTFQRERRQEHGDGHSPGG